MPSSQKNMHILWIYLVKIFNLASVFEAALNLPEATTKSIVLHSKAMFGHNLRCVSLFYDDKAASKPSF